MDDFQQAAGGGDDRPENNMAPIAGQQGGEGATQASSNQTTQIQRPVQFGSVEQLAHGQYPIPIPNPFVTPMTEPIHDRAHYEARNAGIAYDPQQPALGLPNPIPAQVFEFAAWSAANQSDDMDTTDDMVSSASMVEPSENVSAHRQTDKKKGKQRAIEPGPSSSHSEQDDAREDFIASARRRLKDEGIDTDFIDFLEFNSATMVVTQLLDNMESARAAAARERSRAELLAAELKNRKRAHPASPEQIAGSSSRPAKVQQTDSVRIERTMSAMPHREAQNDYDNRRVERRYESEPEPRRFDRREPSPVSRSEYRPKGSGQGRDARLPPVPPFNNRGDNSRPMGRPSDRPSAVSSRSVSSVSSNSHPSPADGPIPRRGHRKPNPLRSDDVTYVVPPPAPFTQTAEAALRPTWPVVLPEGDSDDGRSDSDGKKKKNLSQKKKEGQEQHRANLAAQREAEDPGPLPDALDSIGAGGQRMRDNFFWDMWDREVYYSHARNRIYAREEASRASMSEVVNNVPYQPSGSRLYAIVPRGAPMNPREVQRLVEFATQNTHISRNATVEERMQAFVIMRAFRALVDRIHPSAHDRAMRAIANIPDLMSRPFPVPIRGSTFPPCGPIHRPAGAISKNSLTKRTKGAGLRPCSGRELFDQEQVAQYILHHGRPGTNNAFSGIIVDHAFRMNWASVWGYTLVTILSPSDSHYRAAYARILVGIMLRPFLYADAWRTYNEAHPHPHVSPRQREFTVARFRVTPDSRITENDVTRHLFDNAIPPQWIDHAYLFAIHWWNATWPTSSDRDWESWYRYMDDDRIARIAARGTPPLLRPWSGWRRASAHDVTRLHVLFDVEYETTQRDSRSLPGWTLVGSEVYFYRMPNRSDSYPEPGPSSTSHAPTTSVAGPSHLVASSSATATSTAVAMPSTPGIETIADTTPAPLGPSSSAAATVSPSLPAPTSGGSEATMGSIMGEAPNPTADDPMDGVTN